MADAARGEILLGGSFERANWSREPHPAVTQRIIADDRALLERLA